MKTKILLVVILSVIPLFLTACGGIEDGDTLVTERNTPAWQCPGGEKADAPGIRKAALCFQQKQHRILPYGSEVAVTSNDDGIFRMFGYLRVRYPATYQLPDGEIQSAWGISWVKASDLRSP